jgi:ABC-type transport system involved in Fe-S cluster assembly fused permease/ATPase subunit
VFGLFTCLFAKDHLCNYFQSWLWLEVGLRSQELIFVRTLIKIFDLLEEHDRWATGGFLSDFNKGGSLDACLEEVIFTWFPITFDLLTTSADLWMRLGIIYGLSVAMISP